MISKSQIKLITSLAQKKSRAKWGLFVVEGIKGINELLASEFELQYLFTTSPVFNAPAEKINLISPADLKKISSLTTPQTAVAVFQIPKNGFVKVDGFSIALDGIRDPGNLGTIIRLCDWFGIDQLLCSRDTVDCYNPKVVQASMGSISRVKITYVDLEALLKNNTIPPVIGAFLEGENMYTSLIPAQGILVLGNEANGIGASIEKMVTQKIHIPQFGTGAPTESLNVATATAILLSEYRRQNPY